MLHEYVSIKMQAAIALISTVKISIILIDKRMSIRIQVLVLCLKVKYSPSMQSKSGIGAFDIPFSFTGCIKSTGFQH
jgi:hypothetical protein